METKTISAEAFEECSRIAMRQKPEEWARELSQIKLDRTPTCVGMYLGLNGWEVPGWAITEVVRLNDASRSLDEARTRILDYFRLHTEGDASVEVVGTAFGSPEEEGGPGSGV